MPLFQDAHENVRLERWASNAEIVLPAPGGLEFLSSPEASAKALRILAPQSWLRLPAAATLRARAGTSGCQIWVKTGHLPGRETARPAACTR